MKIAVCISQVPDTATKIIVGGDRKTIDKTGVSFIINPYDEFAIEEGLRLKENFGGEVVFISLGGRASKRPSGKLLRWAATELFL